MNKEEVLKNLFQLPKDDILDILETISGYKTRVNKSKKDTLLMRCVFMKNYHTIKEFFKENEITKDDMLASALNYETTNIKAYLKLKNILHISSSTFKKIIEEIEELDTIHDLKKADLVEKVESDE